MSQRLNTSTPQHLNGPTAQRLNGPTAQRPNGSTDNPMLIATFRDLDAWKAAHDLVLAVYRLPRKFPKDEMFGVTSQVRRSATSIPANIAEGFGRQGPKEFLRFIRIANGSLQETEYFLFLAKDLSYLIPEEYSSSTELSDRTGALLGGLQRSLKNQSEKTGGS